MPSKHVCALWLGIWLAAVPASAQLTCEQPINCTAATRSSQEVIAIKVVDTPKGVATPAKGRTVYFAASSGSFEKVAIAADDSGLAVAAWKGDPSNGQVTITASTIVNGVPQTKTITLGRLYQITLIPPPNGERVWYQDRQLKDPIALSVNATSRAECERAAVAFRAFGDGNIGPDTAWGEWVTSPGHPAGCVVEARWKLGKSIGTQGARYSLVDDATQTSNIEARSRALPWFAIGLAANTASKYDHLDAKQATVRVTRRSLAQNGIDSVEVAYDSVAKSRGVEKVKDAYVFSPVVGVDWAPLLRKSWSNVRVFTGADLRDPTQAWYLGASLLQGTAGWLHEDVPVDLQLVFQFTRREVVTNPGECATEVSTCHTVHRIGRGIGLLVAADAGTALAKLVGALAPSK